MRNFRTEKSVSFIDGMSMGTASQQQIAQLFDALRPDLLRFANWLTRDRSIAEDVVQESLLRAWRSKNSLKDATSVRAWLLTIVRREHARLYERKRLEFVSLDAQIEAGVDIAGGDDAEMDALRHAILTLPLEYREPLIMQVIGGFSTEEIAREMGMSNTAVLTRLCRARNKLRAIYGRSPARQSFVPGEAS